MKTSKDTLGDRMKELEGVFDFRTMPLVPVICRLDGKNFHTFTKGLRRPFDIRLSNVMTELTTFLVEETGALIGYTQSDEITLIWHSTDRDSQIYFDGRVTKMVSISAAMASVKFNQLIAQNIPEKSKLNPLFDSRVWHVPNRSEAIAALIWRQNDCLKNAISMAAQSYYSPKQLHGKTGEEKQEMLFQKGVNFNDYPAFFKRGSLVLKRLKSIRFSAKELESLPPLHAARSNPDLMVTRSVVEVVDLPPLTRIANREAVLFEGATPNEVPAI